jgi:hypothetical protein
LGKGKENQKKETGRARPARQEKTGQHPSQDVVVQVRPPLFSFLFLYFLFLYFLFFIFDSLPNSRQGGDDREDDARRGPGHDAARGKKETVEGVGFWGSAR